MRKKWLWVLSLGLAACSSKVDVELSPGVTLKYQYDAVFQQQAQLLQARQIRVSAYLANTYDDKPPAILKLEVEGIWNKPTPDTLQRRLRKLAHLLVLDLAEPEKYTSIDVQASERTGYFEPYISLQSYIYALTSLR